LLRSRRATLCGWRRDAGAGLKIRSLTVVALDRDDDGRLLSYGVAPRHQSGCWWLFAPRFGLENQTGSETASMARSTRIGQGTSGPAMGSDRSRRRTPRETSFCSERRVSGTWNFDSLPRANRRVHCASLVRDISGDRNDWHFSEELLRGGPTELRPLRPSATSC